MSYYIGNMPFGDPDDIRHTGVKGMKWGKHIKAATEWWKNTINYGNNAQRVQDAQNLRVAAANNNNLNRAAKGFIRKGAMLNELDARQRMNNSAQGMARRAGSAVAGAARNAAGTVRTAIGNAAGRAGEALGNAREAAGNFMKKNVGRNIRRGQLYVGAMAGQAAKKAGEALGNAKEAAGNFAKGAREFVGNTVNYKKNKSRKETLERNIKGRDRNAPTNRSMYVNQLSQWRDAKGKAENSLQGRIGKAANKAGSAFSNARERILDSNAASAVRSAGEGIRSAVNKGRSAISRAAGNAGDAIRGAGSKALRAAKEAGYKISDTARDATGGLRVKAGNLARKAGNAAGKAKDAVGDAIGKGREKITNLFKKKKKK